MKRFKQIMVFLAVMMASACLVACGDSAEENDQVITRDNSGDNATTTQSSQTEDETEEDDDDDDAADAADEAFSFVSEGVTLTPGEAFDAASLPDANDVYVVESCAIDGTDNVYMYDTFELTAFDEGNGEVIYSIYFTDANITTPEGLALGDDASLAIELYGEDYEGDDTQLIYTKGDTELRIILQNDVVTSIEYVLIL